MIIDLKKLRAKGIDELEFSFVYESTGDEITLPECSFDGDITVTGKATLNGKNVFVDAEIFYRLKGECSRCLEPAVYEQIEQLDEEFIPDGSDEEYGYKNDLLDLREAVKDKLLASMPIAIYCKPDCKGLCLGCGANLNKTKCNCEN